MRKHAGSVTTVALVAIALILGVLASTAMAYKADRARTTAEDQSEEYRRLLYAHRIALADASWQDGNAERAEELLEACPNDLRSWEWNRLNDICDQSIVTIGGAGQTIRSAILSLDGTFIASNGWGATVKLWNAEDGTELKTLSGHEGNVLCIALSPDGKQIASGSEDKTVRLWDVETGTEVATLRGHTKEVRNVQFSPDGKRIASAEQYDIIKIWDRATGEAMKTIEKKRTDVGSSGTPLGGLAFSPDGRRIASGGYGEIGIWDVDSGAEVMTITQAHERYVTDVAYDPDGKPLVSCGFLDPRIRIWDAATGEETMSLQTRSRSFQGCVNYDRSGRFIVSGGIGSTIDIWEASSGDNVTTLRGHHRPIQSAVFSLDGSRIVSSGDDKTIKVWDLSSSSDQFAIQTPVRQSQIWFSPDGRHFATAGGLFVPLTLWDGRTGVELRGLLGQTMAVYDCAFSPDGKRVVLGQRHLTVRIWNVETGQLLTVFRGHNKNVFAVAFSPDGKSVASAGGGIIKIWDAATGSELMSMEDEASSTMLSLTYTPDGSRLISCGSNKAIRVWDVARGKEILTIENEGRQGYCLAVSRDGKLIALSHQDSTIPIWDATTGKQVMTLRGHNGIVTMVAFSPVADRLVSCCPNDGTVKVWDTTTGMELMTLDADARTVAFGPDGSTVAAACGEEIVLWETKEPVGGRSPRRNAQAVRQLVGRLHEEHGTYPEVRDQLSGDDTLDQTTRQMALQVVDCRIPQEAYAFAWDVLTTVLPFEKDNQVYEPILVKLEEANRLVPDEGTVLQALGVVQCRLGAYEDALKSLAESWRILSDLGYTSNPATVAYQAKALYEVGRIEEAKAALAKLRKQLDQAGTNWWGGRIGQALLSEMEGLLEDTDP